MGCGASAAAITKDQVNTMCQDACVRMQAACIKAAFAKPKELKIDPPPEVKQLQGMALKLKTKADNLRDTPSIDGGGGGGVAGMLSGAKNMVAVVATNVGAAGLGTAAAALETVTATLHEPFNTVAQDVVNKKGDQLYNTCVKYINDCKFANPLKLTRGTIDGSEYDKTDAKGISTALAEMAGRELCEKLQPDVTEAIKEHLVTTGWDQAQKKYMAAYDLLCKVMTPEDLEKVGVTTVKCDLNTYITNQIWLALATLMAAEEAVIRGLPLEDKKAKDCTVPLKPISFAHVFSKECLTAATYNRWTRETL